MNKTAIQNLARITVTPVQAEYKPQKKRSTVISEDGLLVINEFVSLMQENQTAAAAMLSVNATVLSGWKRGEPIRKVYTDLAKFLIADIKSKREPKIVLKKASQHTAIITLANEHKDDFKAAVESVGGQYTILTYPEGV